MKHSGIYILETPQGCKVGISNNIAKRFKISYLKPWVDIKYVYFLTFRKIELNYLKKIEKLIKDDLNKQTILGSSEFFTKIGSFDLSKKIRYYFYKTTDNSVRINRKGTYYTKTYKIE
jgi:hypothetical protein